MKERPILFTAESVRGIIEGRKTQTRRAITGDFVVDGGKSWPRKVHLLEPLVCPYGQPGDRLWVRETLKRNDKFLGTISYGADGARCTDPNAPDNLDGWSLWRFAKPNVPAIHMPRWASRLTLEITNVRVERVQDISASDALAEGISKTDYWKPKEVDGRPFEEKWWDDYEFWKRYPQIAYRNLWDSINAKRDGGIYAWERNPWVWVMEFKKGITK